MSRFFEQTIAALGHPFEVLRVLCDSGFYLIEFLEHLERRCYSYIVAAPITPPIQREIVRVQRWNVIEEGLEAGEFFFEHADAKWTPPRRYVVVRQHVQPRPGAPGKHGQQMRLFEEYEELGQYRYSVLITNDRDLAGGRHLARIPPARQRRERHQRPQRRLGSRRIHRTGNENTTEGRA